MATGKVYYLLQVWATRRNAPKDGEREVSA